MEQNAGLDLEAIQTDVKEKGQELLAKAAEFAREQPHLAVAAAFGIGWILGNGLSPRIFAAGAKMGLRAALGGALAGTGLLGVLTGEDSSLFGGGGQREGANVPRGTDEESEQQGTGRQT